MMGSMRTFVTDRLTDWQTDWRFWFHKDSRRVLTSQSMKTDFSNFRDDPVSLRRTSTRLQSFFDMISTDFNIFDMISMDFDTFRTWLQRTSTLFDMTSTDFDTFRHDFDGLRHFSTRHRRTSTFFDKTSTDFSIFRQDCRKFFNSVKSSCSP